jgi:hypothetical protein
MNAIQLSPTVTTRKERASVAHKFHRFGAVLRIAPLHLFFIGLRSRSHYLARASASNN